MSNVFGTAADINSPTYSLQQILQTTQPQSRPGGFRRILGAVAGGVGNMVAPGLGGMIGNFIGGTAGINSTGLLGNDTTQYLQLQQEMNMESEAFQLASGVLKDRHDATMAAIRNMSS